MIVLHPVWKPESLKSFNSSFFLWAEASTSGDRRINRGRIRSSFPLKHPYQCKNERLRHYIHKILEVVFTKVGYNPDKLVANKVNIWLPTHGNVPLPSSDFILDEERFYEIDFEKEAELKPWEVEGMEIPFAQLMELFLADNGINLEEVCFGDDWFFLEKLTKFGHELLLRQRFIPSVHINDRGEAESRWKVFPESQRDYERIEKFSKSIPAVLMNGYPCISDDSSFMGSDCSVLIEHYLSSQIDHSMRSILLINGWAKNIRTEDEFSRWLFSLGSAEASVKITDRQRERLINSYANWIASYESFAEERPLKTGMQIIPPQEPNLFMHDHAQRWMLQFFIKATGGEAFRLTGEEVNRLDKEKREIIQKRFGSPEETLLRDLGLASEIFTPIKRGFKSGTPAEVELSPVEAFRFLKESFWLLREAGFFLEIPAWWDENINGSKQKLTVRPRLSDPGKSPSKGSIWDSIVSFNWEIAVGDSVLNRDEFLQLVGLKVPLVQLNGKWLELDHEKMKKTLAFLEKLNGREFTVMEILQKGILDEGSSDHLSIEGFDFSAWLKEYLRDRGGLSPQDIQVPDTFRGTLRTYQIDGLRWLWVIRELGVGGCLADDMGLGKTIQFIALILYTRMLQKERKPYLLVCPTSVVENWAREIDRFGPSLSYFIHHGTDRSEKVIFEKEIKGRDIVVTTFGILRRDIDVLKSISWGCVCLDEAQNIKNPNTKTARAAMKLQADFRIGLTGTPVENHLMELWSISNFLNPGFLGNQKSFKSNFMIPIQEDKNPEREDMLRSLMNPFLLRRKKSDPDILPDLPDKIEKKEYTHLSDEQVTLYQAVVDESVKLLEEAEGIQKKGLILATITKLKQICNHPAHFLKDGNFTKKRSGKLTRLTEMLDELFEEAEAALIFTQYVEMGRMLKLFIQRTFHREALFLHGSVSPKARMRMVDKFQAGEAKNPVFILSLKAGGTGLNLTRASHVFHFDRWWNPAVEAQATDRAYRIGQVKNVQVYSFISTRTYEEKIDEMLEEKKGLADKIIRSGEKGLTELSVEEIVDLITLKEERT